jgi:tryptophan-rich sensory protein
MRKNKLAYGDIKMNTINRKSKIKSLIIALLIPQIIGGLAAIISSSSMKEQYAVLAQPPGAPPAFIFAIIWPTLYLLMGIASWLVWQQDTMNSRSALKLYAIQLFVNFCWPIAFFNLQWRLFAFFWLLALIVLIFITLQKFKNISPAAGWLMLPYLLWSMYAAYLNLGLYLLNR